MYTKCFSVVGEGRENRGPRGDRGDYRRKEGASGDFKPEFRGGLGKSLNRLNYTKSLT
jgi:hypothetical protein